MRGTSAGVKIQAGGRSIFEENAQRTITTWKCVATGGCRAARTADSCISTFPTTATHLASFPLTTSGAELMFSAPTHKATDALPNCIASAPCDDNGGGMIFVPRSGWI